jgi:hypothetical protein
MFYFSILFIPAMTALEKSLDMPLISYRLCAVYENERNRVLRALEGKAWIANYRSNDRKWISLLELGRLSRRNLDMGLKMKGVSSGSLGMEVLQRDPGVESCSGPEVKSPEAKELKVSIITFIPKAGYLLQITHIIASQCAKICEFVYAKFVSRFMHALSLETTTVNVVVAVNLANFFRSTSPLLFPSNLPSLVFSPFLPLLFPSVPSSKGRELWFREIFEFAYACEF